METMKRFGINLVFVVCVAVAASTAAWAILEAGARVTGTHNGALYALGAAIVVFLAALVTAAERGRK